MGPETGAVVESFDGICSGILAVRVVTRVAVERLQLWGVLEAARRVGDSDDRAGRAE